MTILWDAGSILLGLIALAVPAAALFGRSKKNAGTLAIFSFTACSLALFFQLMELAQLTEKGDVSALMDTINARVLAAGALILLTVGMNAVSVYMANKKK